MLKLKRFSFLKDLKENPRETLRKTGKGAVDYAVDNPIDTENEQEPIDKE